jgi:hypothetical protein
MTMSSSSTSSGSRGRQTAGREDLERILGGFDEPKLIDVLELEPTVADLEAAAICMAGDYDVLAKSGHHVSAVAARIIEILTADDEEEPPSPGA